VVIEPLEEIHCIFTFESTDPSFPDGFHKRLLEICARCPATPARFVDEAEKLVVQARSSEELMRADLHWQYEDIEPLYREEAKMCRDERKGYWELFQIKCTTVRTGVLVELRAILRPKMRPVLIVRLGLKSGKSSVTREGVTGLTGTGKPGSCSESGEQVLQGVRCLRPREALKSEFDLQVQEIGPDVIRAQQEGQEGAKADDQFNFGCRRSSARQTRKKTCYKKGHHQEDCSGLDQSSFRGTERSRSSKFRNVGTEKEKEKQKVTVSTWGPDEECVSAAHGADSHHRRQLRNHQSLVR